MLPANDGDCILVQAIGAEAETTSILIDGGRSRSYEIWKPHLDQLLASRKIIDLLVVTHIDGDHVEGIISFLRDVNRDVAVSEIWFNGYEQVIAVQQRPADIEAFSAKQADQLSRLLNSMTTPWNSITSKGPLSRDTVPLPVELGPFKIRIVTPSSRKLAALATRWDAILTEVDSQTSLQTQSGLESFGTKPIDVEELAKSNDIPDTARPNGSSIGFLLNAFGHSILLTGDCHAEDLALGIRELGATQDLPLEVSVMKVSHHGATKNTSKHLLSLIKSEYYAFSTDGQHRDHPDRKIVSKILKSSEAKKVLAFNYESKRSALWRDDQMEKDHNYSVYPADINAPGFLSVTLEAKAIIADLSGSKGRDGADV